MNQRMSHLSTVRQARQASQAALGICRTRRRCETLLILLEMFPHSDL